MRRPKLLLLDEPLTNLDAKLRHDTRAEFKRLHRELGDTTIIYATPDQIEALSMGQRIGVLRGGFRHRAHLRFKRRNLLLCLLLSGHGSRCNGCGNQCLRGGSVASGPPYKGVRRQQPARHGDRQIVGA